MTNVYFQLYLEDILALTRTIVVKCAAIAETLNSGLSALGYTVNLDDPTTWKYYMNIAGEYHPSDTPMMVRSMDTLEQIAFTKANLLIHRATAREYKLGTRYYAALVEAFPDQVPLINGVIAPVNKTKAINAQDGDLLYYDPTYIEANESELIQQLQVWLYGYFNRWYNEQYILTDELYLATYWGMLFQQIPIRLHLFRLQACRTPQVHSYHIREYLASNGRLDAYIPYLTKEQQLYLYRNIRFIQRNVGKQEIFERLVAQLLTKRGLPLTWYKLQHNVENLPDQILPDVEMAKYPINFGYNQTGLDTETVHTILQREYAIARDNPTVMDAAEVDIIARMASSQYSSLATKVLESEVVDRSNSSVRSLENVILNHWVWMSSTGRYRAYVNIPNPGTGEAMSMSVHDAYLVALYCFAKVRGEDLASIPKVIVYEVLRQSLPTYDELYTLVDPKYIRPGFIQAIMDRITPLGEYTSTEAFYNAMINLHQEYLKLWELYSFQEHPMTRALGEHLVKRHFKHEKAVLVEDTTTFEAWFVAQGYGVADLGLPELDQLFADCVKIATGANLVNRITLAEIQRAMLGLMGQLSSYSVQYLRNINDSDFRYIGFPDIRVGDIGATLNPRYRFSGSRITALTLRAKHRHQYNLYAKDIYPPIRFETKAELDISYDPTVGVKILPEPMTYFSFNVATVSVRGYSFAVNTDIPDTDELEQYNP